MRTIIKTIMAGICFATAYSSCVSDPNDESFGKENVYLVRTFAEVPVYSSYLAYGSAPDPNEPLTKTIYVAGVNRSGMMLDPTAVDLEMEVEEGYVEKLIEQLKDPDVETNDTIKHVTGGMILPADCYKIKDLKLRIEADGSNAGIPIELDMAKVKELNPYVKWILPAFRIKSSSMSVNPFVERTIVVLTLQYADNRPIVRLPDDLSGWTNVIRNLPAAQLKQCEWWSSEASHTAMFVVDGDKDNDTASNRWVPNSKAGAKEAPWVEFNFGGQARHISGLKMYYMNEIEAGLLEPTPRANCYVWAKIDGLWFLQEKFVGNNLLVPSFELNIKNATDVRIEWDKILQSTPSYFLKVKEIELFEK